MEPIRSEQDDLIALPMPFDEFFAGHHAENAATGNVVIREGDQPDDLYVVVSGSLVVSVEGRPVGLARWHRRSLGTPTLKRDMAMSSRM